MKVDTEKLYVVLEHMFSLHEADAIMDMLADDEDFDGTYSAEDICEYIDWCKRRHEQDLDTEFNSWLEDRKPRVGIRFMVTEYGFPISGELEFPKRGEDMEHGTEYEWYYSLREVTDEIMKLPVGGSMNFKIRDDKNSHGVIIRTA